jgi:hypothetical protein
MENAVTVELFLQKDTEYRSVRLHLENDGAIKIDAHDMGPVVEQFWDHDDYEFSVTVPQAAVAQLAFELLKDKFAGNLRAVDDFKRYCGERGISHQFWAWP